MRKHMVPGQTTAATHSFTSEHVHSQSKNLCFTGAYIIQLLTRDVRSKKGKHSNTGQYFTFALATQGGYVYEEIISNKTLTTDLQPHVLKVQSFWEKAEAVELYQVLTLFNSHVQCSIQHYLCFQLEL